jgi:hypothetical protein
VKYVAVLKSRERSTVPGIGLLGELSWRTAPTYPRGQIFRGKQHEKIR